MKIVRNPNRWLKKLSRAAALISLAMSTQAAYSQDGAFSFGRTPTGSASEVIDSNRDGFGVSFRGGHTAGEVVGRQESITHINLMPYINIEDGLLFGDARLVRANEGELAWAFGSGYRHYITDWDVVIGGNGYFDMDQLTGAEFKQWGAGAELLAHGWEARGNVYQTFGNTFSAVGSPRVDQSSVAFQGSNISFTRLDDFAEALKGFDAEAGFLLPGDFAERIDLRAFGGGYYYEGENTDAFGGWSSRLQADIGRWLELGLKLTDDDKFNTTVSFNATVHFGGFSSQEHTKRSAIQRFRDPVRRNMNIAAVTTTVGTPGQLARNDANQIFTVAHVNSNDNVGPFNGSVDDPFQTLSAGLASGRDIVFVHAGSSFNVGPENSALLTDGQKLIGEGFIGSENPNLAGGRATQTQIDVRIFGNNVPLILPKSPTFAGNSTLSRPILAGSPANAVTMANDSQFAGFIIDTPTGNGIFASGVDNLRISDVRVENAGLSAIRLLNTTGNISISDASLLADNTSAAATFHVNGGSSRIGFISTDTNLLGFINNTSASEALLIENMANGSNFVMSGVDAIGGPSVTDVGGLGVVIRNNAGDATIDNITSTNSGGTGIAVTDSSGDYIFRKTRSTVASTTITNATDQSILLRNASGSVSFLTPVSIQNRNSAGIEMDQSTGTVVFRENVTFNNHAAAGTGPAIWFHQNAGSLTFARSISIDYDILTPALRHKENGILIDNNLAGSLFSAGTNGLASTLQINGTNLAAIQVTNNAGAIDFSRLTSTTIDDRTTEGIVVQNSAGTVGFGTVNIQNVANSQSTAIDLQDNSAIIGFSRATITNGLTGGVANIAEAVDFVNTANSDTNTAGGINMERNSGEIRFNDLNVQTAGGIGIRGRANSLITSGNGTVLTTDARAIDIRGDLTAGVIVQGGIDMTLESVTSTGSPDYGIVLVETNDPDNKTFIVKPDPVGTQTVSNVGDGGTISGAQGQADDDLLDDVDKEEAAGVFLRNGGQVELNNMILDNNEVGVWIFNTEDPTVDVTDRDEQFFKLIDSEVNDSDIRGIQSVDLMLLEVTGTAFDNNGDDAAEGRETIRLDYITPMDTSDSFDNASRPFIVRIEDTVNNTSRFISDAGDVIRIVQQTSAAHAAIGVEIFDTEFTVRDTVDPTTANGNTDGRPAIDDAIVIDWDGAALVQIANNDFAMDAVAVQQRVLFLNNGDTDRTRDRLTELLFQNNRVIHTNAGNAGDEGSLMAELDGRADIQIIGNDFTLSAIRASAINMSLAGEDTFARFSNNDIEFEEDRGTAILISQAANNSFFEFQSNQVLFLDNATGPERGFIIGSVRGGTIGVGGNSNLMGVFTPANSGGNIGIETPFFAPAGSVRLGSQVEINNVLFP